MKMMTPETAGSYEKLSFSRKEILDNLRKLIEFATVVDSGEYIMIYSGI